MLVLTSSPHIVQVVSILDAPSILGSVSFQSNDVKGAQNSEFLLCGIINNLKILLNKERKKEE